MTLLATALAMGMFAGSANAAPISCNVNNAMANGSVADECVGDSAIGANPTAETTFVNTNFQDGGDPFIFVDKTGENSSVAGFVLTVTQGTTADPYLFDYTLAVPTAWVGEVVDWVLVIKQTSSITIAYLFEDVTLGIDGGFNNFYLNPAQKEVNDYSHASGLLRVAGGDDCLPNDPDCGDDEIPEPGVLFLMGAGLLGLGLARRRKSA
jgi:hypothetical protein